MISAQDLASLQSIREEFKYIARDEDQTLYAYTIKPIWFCDNGRYVDLSMLKLTLPMVHVGDKET